MRCTRQDALNSFVLDLMRLPANWTPLLGSQFMQRTLHAQIHFHVISCWEKQGVNDCALRLKTQAQQEQSPQAALHMIQQVQYRGHSTRWVSHWCRFWWQQIPKVFKDQSHWFATYYTKWSVMKPWIYLSHSWWVPPKNKPFSPVKHHQRPRAPAHLLASIDWVPQPHCAPPNGDPISRQLSSCLLSSQWSKLAQMPITKGIKSVATLCSDTLGTFCWFMSGNVVERVGQIRSLLCCYLSSGWHAFHQAVNLYTPNITVGHTVQQKID